MFRTTDFLLLHYGFESEKTQSEYFDFSDSEAWDEDEEEDEEETEAQQEKRSSLRRSIELVTNALQAQLGNA